MSQILIADIETTGLQIGMDEVLEFSYLVTNEDITEVIDQGVLFFSHPEQRASHPKAFEVHNYTKSFLEPYQDQFHDNMAKMFKLFSKSNFIGWNNERYDAPFITAYLKMNGYGIAQPNTVIDLMKVYTPIYGRTKLVKAIEFMKVDQEVLKVLLRHYFKGYYFRETAHNAAFDVIETMVLAAEAKKEGLF